jgi:hypothetical protein
LKRLLIAACAVLVASACSATAGGGTVANGADPGTTLVSSTSIVALAATRTTLKCSDQLGWPKSPPASFSVVLGKVALPTKRAFGAAKIHDGNPHHKFFAKQALLIKPGAKLELIVPAAWTSRLAIGWGNPSKETTHLWITGCASKKAGAHWLAYAGGYTLSQVACVPLIVKVGTQQKTVHIGAGKACPGQAPPPK